MLILKTLKRFGAMHGYGIAKSIQQTSEEVLRVEEGSLYPALQRILIKGWVTAEWEQSGKKRRTRLYNLTPEETKTAYGRDHQIPAGVAGNRAGYPDCLKAKAMKWLCQVRRRLAVLFRRKRFDCDLQEEMQAHLEMQAEENVEKRYGRRGGTERCQAPIRKSDVA